MDNHYNVWLIWENIAHSTDIYYLPEHMLDDDAYKVLHLCHHHYVKGYNSPEVDEALWRLQRWISDQDGKFSHCQVLTTQDPPETKKPSKVIVTGTW